MKNLHLQDPKMKLMSQLVLAFAVGAATLSVFQNCGNLQGEHTVGMEEGAMDTTAVGSVDPGSQLSLSSVSPAPAPAPSPVCADLADGYAAAGNGVQGNYLGKHPDHASCKQACQLLNQSGACAYVVDRQTCFFYRGYAVAQLAPSALHPVAAALCQ